MIWCANTKVVNERTPNVTEIDDFTVFLMDTKDIKYIMYGTPMYNDVTSTIFAMKVLDTNRIVNVSCHMIANIKVVAVVVVADRSIDCLCVILTRSCSNMMDNNIVITRRLMFVDNFIVDIDGK